jgi:hypothetical protein
MPLFRCDWPNGETTFVLASTKADAIDKLDEFDAAEPEMLRVVNEFMLSIGRVPAANPEEEDDFIVTDIGEQTLEDELKSLSSVEDGDPNDNVFDE